MLVLGRRQQQSTIITVPAGPSRRIEIIVQAILGDKVRLGFVADPEVAVWRKEIQDEIDSREGKPLFDVVPELEATADDVERMLDRHGE